MEETIKDLRLIMERFSLRMLDIPEDIFSSKTHPAKWSKKEVVGHLIDSAHNNLRRFICGQYESTPRIVYDQDFWVIANGYHGYSKKEIIELWKLVNGQIVRVLENMPSENYAKECNTAKKDVQLHALSWLAEDYVKHMKHHINQVIPGSFDISYP